MNRAESAQHLIAILDEDFLSSDLPTAAQLYYVGRKAFLNNDMKTAKVYENLIHLIHNSHIPSSTDIGTGLAIAYSGIGVLVHCNSKIGDYVTLGTNVTLGAAPRVKDHSYISTGAKILRCVDIGPFAIVGANAVVKKTVPPFSIFAGVPAKEIGSINEGNLEKYLEYFCAGRKNDLQFADEVRQKALKELSKKVGN
jgi:serine O-acetyltransferase